MPLFPQKKLPFNPPLANVLASQSTQQPRPVCTWSAHAVQSGSSESPFPRNRHTLTAAATAAGEFLLFGGDRGGLSSPSSDLFVFSTRDFSTILLKTSGEVPSPRYGHGAALIGNTLLICGGKGLSDENLLSHSSLYLLSLGTSHILMSSPTPADHSFALQYHESGPALWSMVPGPIVVPTIPQLWSVPESSSSVVGFKLAGRQSMICGHSI